MRIIQTNQYQINKNINFSKGYTASSPFENRENKKAVQSSKNIERTEMLNAYSFVRNFKGKQLTTEKEYLNLYRYLKHSAEYSDIDRDIIIKQFDIHKPIQYAEGKTDTLANLVKTIIEAIISKTPKLHTILPLLPYKLRSLISNQYTPNDVYELTSGWSEQNAKEIVSYTIACCGDNFIGALKTIKNPSINYFYAKHIIATENDRYPFNNHPDLLCSINIPIEYGKELLKLAEECKLHRRGYNMLARNLEKAADRDVLKKAKNLYEENGSFTIDEINRFLEYKNFNKIMTEPLNDIGENIVHFLPEVFIEKGSEDHKKLRKIFEKLQDAKFDFSQKDNLDRTPLMKAIEAVNGEVAKLLLEFGQYSEKDFNEVKNLALSSDNQELKNLIENHRG